MYANLVPTPSCACPKTKAEEPAGLSVTFQSQVCELEFMLCSIDSIQSSSSTLVPLGFTILTLILSPNSLPKACDHIETLSLGLTSNLSIRTIGKAVSDSFCSIRL